MKIGLTYTLRSPAASASSSDPHKFAGLNGQSSWSAQNHDDAEEEFDSPETIAAIAEALTSLGHEVELLGDGISLASRLLGGKRPDCVFNIAEGRGISRSREAWVPALLEMCEIPYTGSDPLSLAASLDKSFAKRLVREAGVAVPAGLLIDRPPYELPSNFAVPFPAIVKPAFEGSSKGIGNKSVVNDDTQLKEAIARCCTGYQQPVMVEQFIEGDEITVGVLGHASPQILGIMRVLPVRANKPFVYGLEVKRDWRRQVQYEIPARLSPADEKAVCQSALTAFHALGCRDVARLDFRLHNGVPYFLEANPLPGLAPGSSDLVLLAEGMGIGYRELIGRILDATMSRYQAEGVFPAKISHASCKASSLAIGVIAGDQN